MHGPTGICWTSLTPFSLQMLDRALGIAEAPDGANRARLHGCFVPPLIHFIPHSLTYSVHLFLKRQCDRTIGAKARRLFNQRKHRRTKAKKGRFAAFAEWLLTAAPGGAAALREGVGVLDVAGGNSRRLSRHFHAPVC